MFERSFSITRLIHISLLAILFLIKAVTKLKIVLTEFTQLAFWDPEFNDTKLYLNN